MDYGSAEDFCNKAVPIYLVEVNGGGTADVTSLLSYTYHYMYRVWFGRYTNLKEDGKCSYKVVLTTSQKRLVDKASLASTVTSLNDTLCTKVEHVLDSVEQALHDLSDDGRSFSHIHDPLGLAGDPTPIALRLRSFSIWPLFRAVAIAICARDVARFQPGPQDMDSIAETAVLIVLTGRSEGLRAPINFDSIAHMHGVAIEVIDGKETAQTTLGIAVDFVKSLDTQEKRASGQLSTFEEQALIARRGTLRPDDSGHMRLIRDNDIPAGPSSPRHGVPRVGRSDGGGGKLDTTDAEHWPPLASSAGRWKK